MDTNWLSNPVIVGGLVTFIVWLTKKFGWRKSDPHAVGITVIIAIVAAVIEDVWTSRETSIAVYSMMNEFQEFLNTLYPIAKDVVADACTIAISAQIIFRSLQSELAKRTVRSLNLGVGVMTSLEQQTVVILTTFNLVILVIALIIMRYLL